MNAEADPSGRVFIDTNVLVYLHDDSSPAKQAVARSLMLDGELDVILSTQVLSEFFVTVTRKIETPLPPADAREIVETLAALHIVPITRNVVLDAIELSVGHQLSIWDAMILEAASVGGAGYLLTEDLSAGSTVRSVKIHNPFITT